MRRKRKTEEEERRSRAVEEARAAVLKMKENGTLPQRDDTVLTWTDCDACAGFPCLSSAPSSLLSSLFSHLSILCPQVSYYQVSLSCSVCFCASGVDVSGLCLRFSLSPLVLIHFTLSAPDWGFDLEVDLFADSK